VRIELRAEAAALNVICSDVARATIVIADDHHCKGARGMDEASLPRR
jgi:hypothetical protein